MFFENLFRGSSVVERMAVNHLVVGSNPTPGANISISQATGSHPWGKAGGKGRIVTDSGDFSFPLHRFHRRPVIGFEPNKILDYYETNLHHSGNK